MDVYYFIKAGKVMGVIVGVALYSIAILALGFTIGYELRGTK